MRPLSKKTGFTLMELLVVISIIALLMAILMPSLNRARKKARDVWCLTNIHGIMLAVNAYTMGYDDYLPFSGRNWPEMGQLHFTALLASNGLDPSKMNCPSDRFKPGAVAVWWRNSFASTITASNHLGGSPPAGVEVEPDYSYCWIAKMYLDYKANGDIDPGSPVSWKTSAIRYPNGLILFTCFTSDTGFIVNSFDAPSPHGAMAGPTVPVPGTTCNEVYNKGHGWQAGFLDGHADWVGIESIVKRSPGYQFPRGRYNLDWTMNGIKGFDF